MEKERLNVHGKTEKYSKNETSTDLSRDEEPSRELVIATEVVFYKTRGKPEIKWKNFKEEEVCWPTWGSKGPKK